MTRQSLPLLAAAGALAVSLAAPAAATTFQFVTTLSSLGEPTPTSLATGSASVTFDDVAFTVAVDETFSGIAANMSGNHIHCCTASPGTGSASVALGFTGLATGTSGQYTNTFTMPVTNFSFLLAGVQAGKGYVNIHTPGVYSGGEIRGFLVPVPEPSTYAIMLCGLGLIGWVAKRRPLA